MRLTSDAFRDAAEHHTGEARAAVGADDDHVGPRSVGDAEDRGHHMAKLDVDLRGGPKLPRGGHKRSKPLARVGAQVVVRALLYTLRPNTCVARNTRRQLSHVEHNEARA